MQNSQTDMAIRFWNDSTKDIESGYYDSKFLHLPNANELL